MATGSAGTRLRPVRLSGATPLDEINREASPKWQHAFTAWQDASL